MGELDGRGNLGGITHPRLGRVALGLLRLLHIPSGGLGPELETVFKDASVNECALGKTSVQ